MRIKKTGREGKNKFVKGLNFFSLFFAFFLIFLSFLFLSPLMAVGIFQQIKKSPQKVIFF